MWYVVFCFYSKYIFSVTHSKKKKRVLYFRFFLNMVTDPISEDGPIDAGSDKMEDNVS